MLLELKVKDFAIIDKVDIIFENGLNVLSGETGAGKSVLLKGLALLMGEKALSDTVRTGASQAIIEGYFDLSHRSDVIDHIEAMGIDAVEDGLVVRRMISREGKSRVYLNGSLSTLTSLKEVVAPLIELTGQAAPLIEMTGQHDNRHLHSRAYQLDVLDHYTGSFPLRKKVAESFYECQKVEREIERLEEDNRNREQRLDFLSFQRDEIKELDLEPGSEQDLESQVGRLKNSSRLGEFVDQAERTLYSDDESALVRLHQVLQTGQELALVDKEIPKKIDNLVQAKTLIEESIYEIREYGRGLNESPEDLNKAEEQLSLLRRLQKKYGLNIEEIRQSLERIEIEINELENFDESLKELNNKLKGLQSELRSESEELHRRRMNGADLLAKSVNDELADLNMKGLEFVVDVDTTDEVSSTGISRVEFKTKVSKKDEAKPLAKYASGGELSRILLALKCVVGQSEKPRTYLFDEVDAGVSGETAEKVGQKLKSIAQGQQVICVTHLPQVASFADIHFRIQKSPSQKGVKMELTRLGRQDRVKEIARLISGEQITKTSLDHAKQLLAGAANP